MCSLVSSGVVTKEGQKANPDLVDADGRLLPEMTTDDYLTLFEQMARAKVKSVLLTGGEPTLRRDILEISRAIKQHGFRLEIDSNGAIRPELFRELVRIGVDSIQISVDGTQKVHDQIRGVPGSFRRALSAIEAVAEERKSLGRRLPSLNVSCAISALNHDKLVDLFDFFKESEIDHLNFGHIHYTTLEKQHNTEKIVSGSIPHYKDAILPDEVFALDVDELARQIEAIKSRSESARMPVSFTPNLDSGAVADRYSGRGGPYSTKCFYPWLSARIDPWGQMFPCWIDIRIGDVREHSFEKLWNGEEYRRFRRLIRREKLVPKCATCCALTDKTWSYLPKLIP
jgi:MoaA/NifB/PqqE/SkfB family radical SAM enzyme